MIPGSVSHPVVEEGLRNLHHLLLKRSQRNPEIPILPAVHHILVVPANNLAVAFSEESGGIDAVIDEDASWVILKQRNNPFLLAKKHPFPINDSDLRSGTQHLDRPLHVLRCNQVIRIERKNVFPPGL